MSSEGSPITVTPMDGGWKVAFRGPVQSPSEFMQAEMDRVVKSGPKVVEWDLMGIESIASAGLGILVSFRNRIIAAGGAVRTVAVHPRVLEVLKLSGLVKIFNVVER